MTPEERSALERFPLVAQEFCRYVDDIDGIDIQHLIQGLTVHLARLCEVAACLPWVEPATSGIDCHPEEITAHTKEYMRLKNIWKKKLGSADNYWEIFDPTEKEELVEGSLSGDIAEIYLDLKDAISLLTNGTAAEDVYFDWRLTFHSHWSRHAANALKVTLALSDRA